MKRLAFLSLLIALPALPQARPISTLRPKPFVTLGDTVTVSATPSAVSFTLVHGAAATASSPVSITTTWSGINLLSSITLYGFFTSSTSALSGGTPVSNIPTSCVFGTVPTGTPTSYTAFTQTNTYGGAGAGLQLYAQNSSLGGNRTDSLSLKIDLTSIPQLPAAVYSGVLMLEAQAF